MDYWRRSAIIVRVDKLRNDIIREKMKVKNNIVEDISTRQLGLIWYGHVMRMNEERLGSIKEKEKRKTNGNMEKGHSGRDGEKDNG
ncbi:hypothetical protein ANN_04090 [Periplaneta americana]|uniref:Uncharacterized protein n=1 Tax=Periplaneta americana TaxID=6978 RepID=A0ABQ8T970_PERAM|nr:hypothetical protein ANN_04090 [Periplaneta americana]